MRQRVWPRLRKSALLSSAGSPTVAFQIMSSTKGSVNDAFISFVYVADLARSDDFYRRVLGLPLVTVQEVCRIYQVSQSGYLGICSHRPPTPRDSVILTLVRDDVEEFCVTLTERGAELEDGPRHNDRFGITHVFLRDPDGHLIEVQRFDDPAWSEPVEN